MKKGSLIKVVSLIIAAAFLLQGCAYTYKVDTRLDELSRTPKRVEISRENRIETLSPSSVRVYHDVSTGQKVKYEKMEVKHQQRADVADEIFYDVIGRPVILAFSPAAMFLSINDGLEAEKQIFLVIFSPDAASRNCDNCTKTTKINPTGETITKNENITTKQIPITSGKVAVYVEGKHTADIPIKSNGTARFSFGNYPVPLKGLSNVEVEYKYKDAAASSLIAASEYAEEVKKHSKPCALAAAFEFIDNDGYKPNGAIDAGEKAFAKVLVKNSGKGTAYSVVLVGESSSDFIKLPGRTDAGDIPAGETKQVLIPLKGDVKTPAGSVKLKFYAEEERGYGSNTLVKQIETRALVPTGLEIVSHRILDGKAGFAEGNGNGIPENGETFELEIFVKNSGRGKAKDVKITASIAEPGVNLERSNAVLGDIAPGRTVTAKLVVSLNRDLKTVLLRPAIKIKERFGRDNLSETIDIPVRLQKPVLTLAVRTGGSKGAVIRNGDTAWLDLSIANRAGIDARNVEMKLSVAEKGPKIITNKNIELGDIQPNSETNPHRVKIHIPRTYQGKGVTLNVRLDQDEFESVKDISVINISPSIPQLMVKWRVVSGMLEGRMQIGQSAHLRATIENMGEIPAQNVVLKLKADAPSIFPNFPGSIQERELKTIPAHGKVEEDFYILAKRRNAASGSHFIELLATQDDFSSAGQKLAFKTVDDVEFEKIAAAKGSKTSAFTASLSPPMIWISYPNNNMIVHDDIITLQGYAHDDKGVSRMEIRLNGAVAADKGQRDISVIKQEKVYGTGENRAMFSQPLALKTGLNTIEVTAWDTDNLEDKKTIRINRSPTKSEIWAAVIGINDYQNSGIPDLEYAVADAGAVYDYLHNNMKVPQDHIFSLYNKQAGKQEVEKVLGDILPKKAKPQDTVIIYYSGHGAPYPDPSSPDGDGVSKYLLTSDTDPESMWATAVEMESIRKIFNRLSSERVVFLADTCYSGASGGKSFALSTRAVMNNGFLERLAEGRGKVIITASGAGELATEDPDLGGGHGVFTYYLLEGLKGAAETDGDGLITAGEVYQYVYRKVSKFTDNRQRPFKSGTEERPIILGVIK